MEGVIIQPINGDKLGISSLLEIGVEEAKMGLKPKFEQEARRERL